MEISLKKGENVELMLSKIIRIISSKKYSDSRREYYKTRAYNTNNIIKKF